jgi:uncharacterized membrane protein YkgB
VQTVSWIVGAFEWSIALLLLLGFWDKRLGAVGAAGSACAALAGLSTIPFMPNGWDAVAGGFPAMTGSTTFLIKDVVFLAASIYLIKRDASRALAVRG